MYLGLDIGTSAVKAVVVDDANSVVAEAAAQLTVDRPHPGWSEQYPEDWWSGVGVAVGALPAPARAAVRAIGLAGQMHGAVLLDDADRPLRPAILWNDGRSTGECGDLEAREPATRAITGNAAMPGFTAPKLLWVRKHEPECARRIAKILLPKDYVRLRMTGDHATDLSDASGTLWLDVGGRRWSPEMLAACDLAENHMPSVHEGTTITGRLRADVAAAWGMARVPVAAGGGDNAAGAVGAGVVHAGDAFISLGTSGVVFVVGDRFAPAPDRGAHAFCHALPSRWHQMAVMLSAAASLEWASRLLGFADVASAVEAASEATPFAGDEIFLPYLSGERTPHNDASARGAFVGLSHGSGRSSTIAAVLEGVAFGLADGLDVLTGAGAEIGTISVIGGGARSPFWSAVLAAALDRPLVYRRDAHIGPAFGAARLARMATERGDPIALATPPEIERIVEPDRALVARARSKLDRYRRQYAALKGNFA